ncbi:hypothetical protein DPQ22_05075 [Candidatus Tokpelaia sp.]|nr:hypothetical protein DPQ22_05075 [Candidatus Tokpelaia sp.]
MNKSPISAASALCHRPGRRKRPAIAAAAPQAATARRKPGSIAAPAPNPPCPAPALTVPVPPAAGQYAPIPPTAPAKAAQKQETKPGSSENPSFRREMLSLLPGLRAFAVSLAGNKDQADDLLQDTIMRAWGKQESFTMGTNMKAWLFTILRNEFYSQMRKQKREVQDTDGIYANNLAVHPAQYGALDLQDFKRALDKLPPDQREAIILIGASGFSYEEAAEICRCAIGTIKSRVSRARLRLQNLLSIEGENDYGPDKAAKASAIRSF